MTLRSVSVLIATYNRGAILRETPEAMYQVNREGIDVKWIVIDNSYTDNTDALVPSDWLRNFLSLRPLWAAKNLVICLVHHFLCVRTENSIQPHNPHCVHATFLQS